MCIFRSGFGVFVPVFINLFVPGGQIFVVRIFRWKFCEKPNFFFQDAVFYQKTLLTFGFYITCTNIWSFQKLHFGLDVAILAVFLWLSKPKCSFFLKIFLLFDDSTHKNGNVPIHRNLETTTQQNSTKTHINAIFSKKWMKLDTFCCQLSLIFVFRFFCLLFYKLFLKNTYYFYTDQSL